VQAEGFAFGVQERSGSWKRGSDHQEEESFEGETPRALRVERDLQGSGGASRREGSQTLGAGLLGSEARFPDASQGAKRRAFGSGNAEGAGASARRMARVGSVDWAHR